MKDRRPSLIPPRSSLIPLMPDSPPTGHSEASAPTATPGTVHFFASLRIISLCTLFSRVLGLVRDVGMAGLFGNGPVMDAFSVAFRIPNLARRLFGEGALAAAFLPAFLREREHAGASSAWELATAVFAWLALALSGLVLAGELVLWGLSWWGAFSPETVLLLHLTAVMLPYLILICLAAQVSAVLQALDHFTWPALLPVLLNVIWIGCLWGVAPWLESPSVQMSAVAVSILVAGFVQLAAPLPTLRRLGFRFQRSRERRAKSREPDKWPRSGRSGSPLLARFPAEEGATGTKVVAIAAAMLPLAIGLSITQLNTLADSLIAWGFSQPETGSPQMLLSGGAGYPLEAGTASALYFGQRIYQFPLGVFGVALGTVLYPQLSRHAESGRLDRLRDDLSLGLRLVVCIGLPASLGLVLLAEPLTALLFQHGAFDTDDARQTVGMISAYGLAVWAYCGLLIVHRGYYAVGDRYTPLRIGLVAVALNLVLDFTLIWPIGGPGLALATALAAMLQVVASTWYLQRHIGRLIRGELLRTTIRAAVATLVMGAVCGATLAPWEAGGGLLRRSVRVLVPLVASVAAYFVAARLLGLDELWLLFRRHGPESRGND